MGNLEEIERLLRKTLEIHGSIDIVVNNAAANPVFGPIHKTDTGAFDKIMDVNLKGPFRLSANIGARMAAGEGGSIINISSTASVNASPNSEPYGAAKAGLNALTNSFAHAYGPKVRVNCIMPGPFLTDISKAWDMEAFNERARTTIPLQRGGEPDEIVGAALYFASDASSYTTGSVLKVDGGSAYPAA